MGLSPTDRPTSEQLVPYFDGQASASERRAVERWAAASAENAASLERQQEWWNALGGIDADRRDRSAQLGALRLAARQPTPRMAVGFPLPLRSAFGIYRLMGIAAAAVVCVSATLLLTRHYRWPSGLAGREGTVVLATRPGERATRTLPDGTRITLAPSSRLVYSASSRDASRAVTLEGEGYFEVVHEQRHPFSVRVANAVVTDIGTAFDVRAYAADKRVRIAVADGRVDLALVGAGQRTGRSPVTPRPLPDEHLLSAGDVATISDTDLAVTRGADIAAATAWTTGQLVFSDATLAQVIPDLERWYGVTIHVADSALNARRLTTRLREGPVDEVLSAVALAVDGKFERRGSAVTFYGVTH